LQNNATALERGNNHVGHGETNSIGYYLAQGVLLPGLELAETSSLALGGNLIRCPLGKAGHSH